MKNSKQLFKKTVKPDFLVITAFFNVKHSNIFQGCNYTGLFMECYSISYNIFIAICIQSLYIFLIFDLFTSLFCHRL